MLETAIIGAGPYGLSIAAHFRSRGIPFRIFGRLMDSWLAHMPKGMCLKSDGFASNIYDPEDDFTLQRFCAQQGIEYSDAGIPVRLDTFTAYGQAFKERKVPELEDKMVTSLARSPEGFRLGLDDGEVFTARRVVLAVGITHFEYVPSELASLPSESLSHSFRHRDLEPFRGRSVVVIGGGSSATDLAGLLHEVGADVQLISRRTSLKFHGAPKVGEDSFLVAEHETSADGNWSRLAVALLCRRAHGVSLPSRKPPSGGCPENIGPLGRMVRERQGHREGPTAFGTNSAAG